MILSDSRIDRLTRGGNLLCLALILSATAIDLYEYGRKKLNEHRQKKAAQAACSSGDETNGSNADSATQDAQ